MDFDFNDLNFINYAFSSVNLAISSFKILLSLLIFYIILTNCTFKQPEIILIFILSNLEFISGTSLLLSSIFKFVFGYEYFKAGGYPCWIVSLTIIGNARCEMITITVLAILRYSIVCHNVKQGTLFWLAVYLMMLTPIAAIFLYPFVINDADPSPSYIFCSPYIKPSPLTQIVSFIIPLIYLIPCWIVTFCYFEIGRKAYKNLRKMKLEAIETNDISLKLNIKKQSKKLTIQLIMIFILFNVNFMPSYIGWILRVAIEYKRTPIFDVATFELIELSLAIDPIITVTFQPELNHEINFLIFKVKLKLKSFIYNLI
ncbi:family A G protein-coupled receptor-like protein [Conidiobolus coronatus NRRL 28638]|uniref:Family A G protein-coupled receptor-like protein n=1 Tax=Conidiobolus coronatus (strain ATCC 28846 / CBS 209.66 / NRRL 28638) TaxID=796925 RepID=A0A137NSW2_CONC2|nr:family A G protein-coupled receptor-like protein [Conidiobolus coronatus NRRL 28638]|eukprot:KXN65794.1 family A G protein-coupled receptor-like protein [Conidiobolus coronatus NRRL 28638]